MENANLQHHKRELNGIEIHYVEMGEGPLVVLLHGFPEFWYSWRHQIPELAKNFKVVAPDMRGYNLSSKPKKVSDYQIQYLTQDVAELVTSLGYSKAHIVGHDWGGYIAFHLAMFHSELVDKLIVLNAPHPIKFKRVLRTHWRQALRSWYVGFFQIPWLPETYLKLNLRAQFNKIFKGWSFNKEAFSDEDIGHYVEAFKRNGALKAAINYYRAASIHYPSSTKTLSKRTERLKNMLIDAPTRVIWAKDDRALGIELSRNLDLYFTNFYDIHYIEKCSHWVQNEQPERVNELITDFLVE